MSCEFNREKYLARMARDPACLAAFGSEKVAREALRKTFDLARAQAGQDGTTELEAEARTRKLFGEMRKANIQPPTHSLKGLPKKDAQYGYAALHRALEAARSESSLPELTRQIVDNIERREETLDTVVNASAGAGMILSAAVLPPAGNLLVIAGLELWRRNRHSDRAKARARAEKYRQQYHDYRQKHKRKDPNEETKGSPNHVLRWKPW